ncbi:MAG: FprA family A-type flavoprotein [Bacteroidales bacterium]|nr:FprA family A-type flavoprotein [Bacteroidales bacterium]
MDNKILEITKDVKWIGALDHDIRTFDIVMETKYGTTYNSYFINADKKTIVETVKEKFADEYLEKVRSVVKPEEIEYIIVNHTEPDHSGSVKHLMNIAPNAKVVGSNNAVRNLTEIIGHEIPNVVVKEGDVLDLGNKKIKIIGAPNLHWPDTIYSYLEEDKILFTCDSFGAHYCNEAMFDDMVPDYDDAFKYYFDVILRPFSKFMLKAIEKIRPLEIDAICTGHGPILRGKWKKYVDLSEEYARKYMETINPEVEKILIVYVSAYGFTGEIAKAVAEGVNQIEGFDVEVLDIEKTELPILNSKIEQCKGLLIGSPTINQNTLMQIYNFLALINPLRDRGKLAGSFGSYGWSGEAPKIIDANLRNLKFKVELEPLTIKFRPNDENKIKCIEFGKEFGRKMLENKNVTNE